MYMYVYVLHAALDVQSCGITTEGGSHLQEVLKLNATLIVLDLRANALLGMDSTGILNTPVHDDIMCLYLLFGTNTIYSN